jgi:hypothetical protein
MMQQTTNTTTSFQTRRRRKRKQQSATTINNNNKEGNSNNINNNNNRIILNFQPEDDAKLAFLDRDGDNLNDSKCKFKSLPLLLEQRRSGLLRGGSSAKTKQKQEQFQTEMLFNFTKKTLDRGIARRQWRPYAHKSVTFTSLGTPPSDAVLSMNRQGTALLSLGTKDDPRASPGLALRFYGLRHGKPNELSTTTTRMKAPLLQTVPLLHGVGKLDGRGGEEAVIFNFHGAVSPASTPVRVLMSNDWKIGVALVTKPKPWDASIGSDSGTLILFSLSRGGRGHDTTKVYTCNNVDIPSSSVGIMRNLLWQVHTIPYRDGRCGNLETFLINSYYSAPGYVFFNDEGDGFRMTWLTEETFISDQSCQKEVFSEQSPLRKAVHPDTMILSSQDTWEENVCDIVTGSSKLTVTTSPSGVSVVTEAYLHMGILLGNILSKRKIFAGTHPDYFYELISLQSGGRIANLVIIFERKIKACALGVFVDVDLFTGAYEELDWVQSKETKDFGSLRIWCKRLAINRRMKQLRAGPYSVDPEYSMDGSRLAKETNTFDNDQEDDYDEKVWHDFVLGKGTKNGRSPLAPKLVTLSSLYQNCDTVSNDALLNCKPVLAMRAKDAPIRLRYG